MYTRTDYLENRCTHEQYYAQLVLPYIKRAVFKHFGVEQLQDAARADHYLNSIRLSRWDDLARAVNTVNLCEEFQSHGDYPTLAGIVCVLKQAAREIVAENPCVPD